MNRLERLKAKAKQLNQSEFGDPDDNSLVWITNGTIHFGIDWEGEYAYIIDLEHPDGDIIERTEIQLDRIWEAPNGTNTNIGDDDEY